MQIVITPQIRKSDRHAKGYYVAMSTNGTTSHPIHNFRNSLTGAHRSIHDYATEEADALTTDGNEVHINPVKF